MQESMCDKQQHKTVGVELSWLNQSGFFFRGH